MRKAGDYWYCMAPNPIKHLPRKDNSFVVGNELYPIHEAYCKIPIPFETAIDLPDTLVPLVDWGYCVPTEGGGRRLLKTMQTSYQSSAKNDQKLADEYKHRYEMHHWKDSPWREIADKYDLHIHPEIDLPSFFVKFVEIGYPANLASPRMGYLNRSIFLNIVDILKSISVNKEIYVDQSVPHCMPNHFDDGLQIAAWDELPVYFESDFCGGLYALNKSWELFTDTDLYFTLFGGPKQIIDLLSANKHIEIIECNPYTRIDRHSDKINPQLDEKEWQGVYI